MLRRRAIADWSMALQEIEAFRWVVRAGCLLVSCPICASEQWLLIGWLADCEWNTTCLECEEVFEVPEAEVDKGIDAIALKYLRGGLIRTESAAQGGI